MGGAVTEITSRHQWASGHSKISNPIIVDFSAAWCGPCKAIAPHYEHWSQKYTGITFWKVDVDQQQDLAGECGVTAMPTFQIFQRGRKVEEIRGADMKGLIGLLEKYNQTGGAFSGQGRTLAGGDAVGASQQSSQAGMQQQDASGQAEGFDPAKPATFVQIRLPTGAKLTATFNPSQTVADLRRYLAKHAPGIGQSATMTSSFPPRPLVNDEMTLEAAGVVNSVVNVR